MSRRRYVGRQAAADDDYVTLKVQNALRDSLPGLYVALLAANQPQGYPRLDANSRMDNLYLPTDISQASFTASGAVTAAGKGTVGSLESKGAAKVASLDIADASNVAGSISRVKDIVASGAISGASATLTGAVKAATADIPEITSAATKMKALTVDSINNPGGGLTVAALVSQGSIAATVDSTANQDVKAGRNVLGQNNVTAGETVQGKNLIASLNVGAATLSTSGKATLNSAEVTNALAVSGKLTASGGIASAGQTDIIAWLDSKIAALDSRVADVESAQSSGDPLVAWIVPTLSTGVTSSSLDPFMYRVIDEYGRKKVQMRGRLNLSSAITTLFVMPSNARPTYDLAPILLGREFGGGGLAIIMDVKAAGQINLAGHTTGAKSGQVDVGGSGTAAVSVSSGQPNTAPNNTGYAATSAVSRSSAGSNDHIHNFDHTHQFTVTGLAHQHTVSPITYATFVGFTGVEYFL